MPADPLFESVKLLLPRYRDALQTFASSRSRFQVLNSCPSTSVPPDTRTLYVLDSSFNPPTLAHLRIAVSALRDDKRAPQSLPKRLLLLLATQNADKAPKPASFEQRLVMMGMFASDLAETMNDSVNHTTENREEVVVDLGVTKEPYFHNKATAIEESDFYKDPKTGKQPEQVHLLGYDSLIRLLDTKYYPPSNTLQPLDALFAMHRIRVTRRPDDGWGGREEQDAYVKALEDGKREAEGGKSGWGSRIDFVEGRKECEEAVSSTKVREAAKKKNKQALGMLVTRRVASYVMDEELYLVLE